MKTLIIFCFSIFTLTAFTQPQFNNFEEANAYIEKIIGFDGSSNEGIKIHKTGHTIMNMGTACAGRYSFKLQEVKLSQRIEKSVRCGVNREEFIISFECENDNCILDPLMLEFEPSGSSGINFSDIQKGLKFYNVLVQLQGFLKK